VEIEEQMRKQIINTLDSYNVGLHIAAVTLKEAKAPEQVKAAFDDVTKAREDRERFIHEAESYYNKIVPEAKGQAQQMLQEADAYKQEAINAALGDTQRFNMILPEYKKAPKVTKTRLYLDALEQVLSNSSKIMVDLNGGNNLVYLPLDRLMATTKADKEVGNKPMVEQIAKNGESAVRSYDRRREN
jgi:membrane protease subunit HflK